MRIPAAARPSTVDLFLSRGTTGLLHRSEMTSFEVGSLVRARTAREEGVRAGVEAAITALGTGFLRPKHANRALHEAIERGELDKQDYYRQLLRLVYRLIFLFVAEDRDALLPPDAPAAARSRYERFYTTKRLRDRAGKRRGGQHTDLWRRLRLVLGKLWNGSPALGLPALGSFLWDPRATGNLNDLELGNEDLILALRALCYVEQDHARYAVSFRNIGAEELGSVYESLLELHPEIHRDSARFELGTAAGHERKTTSSYYTPTSLVDCVLDSALDPALDEAAGKDDAEAAILALKVCDPACGSGHFLVAAARRIAARLAMVRSGGEEPSPPVVQRALRDVVGHCIYGVDLSPMAVELCKVSLWMEAIEPGKPLSSLDAHIQQGNALIGTTPGLMAKGIPDEAFEALAGDDKAVAKRLKKANKDARGGQPTPGSPGGAWELLTGSPDYTRATFLADAWCAAFFWKKQEGDLESGAVTEALWRDLGRDGAVMPANTWREVRTIAREHGFFHWHLAFPQVFFAGGEDQTPAEDSTGLTGGFDVVLGNPPWDTLSPDAKEFFSRYDPQIRFQDPATQARMIETLLGDALVAEKWTKHRRELFATAHFLKNSGRYRLYAPGNLGKGDFNVYRMFVETALDSVRSSGRVAQIVPEGMYNGANCMAIRQHLFDRFTLDRVLGFENARQIWFQGIDGRTKFAIYSAQSDGVTSSFDAAFNIRSPAELARALGGSCMNVPVSMVEEFSPDALAIMEFQSQAEIDIATRMYARWKKFGEAQVDSPCRHYMTEIHMGSDREMFDESATGLPLYEGRMVAAYDHRAKGYRSGRGRSAVWDELSFDDPGKSIQPQWRIPEQDVPGKAVSRVASYRIGFCDVASPTNERSFAAALIPPATICGHKVPTITYEPRFDWAYGFTLAVANSFTLDFIVRKKVSLSMTYTILDSLPVPRLPRESAVVSELMPLVLRLTCTGPEMLAYWNKMSEYGWVAPVAGEEALPGLVDEEERLRAIAEVEAIVAHDLYELTRQEVSCVMDTFPIVEKRDVQKYGSYRTKELILAAYDLRSSSAGKPPGFASAGPVPPAQNIS